MCDKCTRIIDPRLSDDTIKKKLTENGCEFVCTRRETIKNKPRVFIKFICSCDINTARIIKESQWEVISSGGKCSDCGNARRKETIITSYNNHGDEIHEKMKKTCNERYGVNHPMHHAEIFEKAQKNSYYKKEYTFPSGRTVLCQGYENLTLDLLLKNKIHEDDIYIDRDISSCNALPKFIYEFIYEVDGKQHRYYPDIYVASEDKFIEVKSRYTFDINKDNVMLKAQTVKRYGYDIEIWIFDKKEILEETIIV